MYVFDSMRLLVLAMQLTDVDKYNKRVGRLDASADP
jgi:hypothetical protein